MSEKKERFVRLAEARVSRAMESIRIIGNLAKTNNYEYDNDDVQAIVKALQAEVAKLKLQFEIKSGNSKQQFKLGKLADNDQARLDIPDTPAKHLRGKQYFRGVL